MCCVVGHGITLRSVEISKGTQTIEIGLCSQFFKIRTGPLGHGRRGM